MCNFANMEQTLPEIIRQNDGLRQALLAQEGGIMKYLAEHLDADGLPDLYKGYRDQCTQEHREAHKWSLPNLYLRIGQRAPLGEEHIRGELKYLIDLDELLSRRSEDEAWLVCSFIRDYMRCSFYYSLRLNEISAKLFYENVIRAYEGPFGLATRCLWRVLNEHRRIPKEKKDKEGTLWELWEEFVIEQYGKAYRYCGILKLRQAVKELIDSNTRGKTDDESRKICRRLAVDTMRRLRRFTRLVNGDDDLVDTAEEKYITAEEMRWLREGIDNLEDGKLMTCMQISFSQSYYTVLTCIASFWAAQLLVHGIDMKDLEKETGTVLSRRPDELYYVDSLVGDTRGDCCVFDWQEAKELLEGIKQVKTAPSETQIMEEGGNMDAHEEQTPPTDKKPRKRGRPAKKFEDFVHGDAPKELMPVLEKMMQGASARQALTIIMSITGVYIDKPTSRSVCKRFNTVEETAYGEAVARHKGITYGNKDFSQNPSPITDTDLAAKLKEINGEIEKMAHS